MKKQYKKLIAHTGVYSIGTIAEQALFLILVPLYTRYLNPVDFGILALMNITILVLTKAISGPVTIALGRYYYKPDFIEKQKILLMNLLILIIAKTAFLVVLYLIFSKYLANMLLGKTEYLYLVKVYAFILLLDPLSVFSLFFIRLLEKAKFYVAVSLSNIILSCALIVFLIIKMDLGILAVVYGKIFSLTLSIIMCLPVVLRLTSFKIDLSVLVEPLKFGYPQILSVYSNLIFRLGDRIILRIYQSVASVGLYSIGHKIASLTRILIVIPLRNSLKPIILKKENDPESLRKFLANCATYFLLLGSFFVLGLSLFSRELVVFITGREEYWSCWKVVPLLSLAFLFNGLGTFAQWGMVMKNKPYHLSGTMLMACIINICLNFLMIPRYGIIGAANATLIAYIFWWLARIYFSAKLYDLRFQNGRIAHILSVGLVIYLMSLFLVECYSIGNIFEIMTVKLGCLLSYPLLIFVTGFFKMEEKEFIKKLVANVINRYFKRMPTG
ncbi:MAG: oligosaccharide flippase family protein [Candidatus Theseobacter exili]|nr:oligosaccharide flippase family protein [Candidatus Theseobacter exili]